MEVTEHIIRTLIGLTQAMQNNLLAGPPTFAAGVLTYTDLDGGVSTLDLSSLMGGGGGGAADGVLNNVTFSIDGETATFHITDSPNFTVNIPEALRAGGGGAHTAQRVVYNISPSADTVGKVVIINGQFNATDVNYDGVLSTADFAHFDPALLVGASWWRAEPAVVCSWKALLPDNEPQPPHIGIGIHDKDMDPWPLVISASGGRGLSRSI